MKEALSDRDSFIKLLLDSGKRGIEELYERYQRDAEGSLYVLRLLLDSLAELIPEKVGVPLRITHSEMENIYDGMCGKDKLSYESRNKGILLNEIITILKESNTLDARHVRVPQIKRRNLALTIDPDAWSRMDTFEALLEYFIGHYPWDNETEEDIVCSAVFAAIATGSLITANAPSRMMRMKVKDIRGIDKGYIRYSMRTSPLRFYGDRSSFKNELRTRTFLNPLAQIYLNRILLSYGKPGAGGKWKIDLKNGDSFIFPQEFLKRENKRYLITRVFQEWLDRLTELFIENQKGSGVFPNGLKNLSTKHLVECSRIRIFLKYQLFLVPCLQGKTLYDPVCDNTMENLFLDITKERQKGVPKKLKKYRFKELEKAIISDDTEMTENTYSEEQVLIYTDYLERIRCVLKRVDIDTKLKERKALSLEVKKLVDELNYDGLNNKEEQPLLLSNLYLLLRWLVWLLEDRKKSPKTVRNYFSIMPEVINDVLEGRSITEIDKESDIKDIIQEAMYLYENRWSMKSIRTKFRSFLEFLRYKLGYAVPIIKRADPDLRIPHEISDRDMLAPSDVESLIKNIEGIKRKDVREALKVLVILSFYGGLRRSEVARLSLSNILSGKELNIFVHRSKTSHGRRCIPLHLLLPSRHLKFLNAYYNKREKDSKGRDRSKVPFLSLKGQEGFLNPDMLSKEVTSRIKSITGSDLSTHDLRHGFGSWLLLRLFAVIFGKEHLPDYIVRANPEFFSEKELSKLRRLFSGEDAGKTVTRNLSDGLAKISKLLGHADPMITLNVYIHTVDWIQKLMIDMEKGKISMERGRISKLTLKTAPTILKPFPKAKGKRFDAREILNYQKSLVRKLFN